MKEASGFLRWTVVVAAMCFVGCAHRATHEAPTPDDWAAIARTLESTNAPDSLVAAALIRKAQLRDSPGSLDDLDRALRTDPHQPDAAWLALGICTETPGCPRGPRESLLEHLDPGNAAAKIGRLTDARSANDAVAEDAALASMAESTYFDVYWSRLIARSSDALSQADPRTRRPLRALEQAAVDVVGFLAALSIPPFSSVSNTCKGERLGRDDVVARCRKLAMVLANGDTYIASSMGRAIAKRVWPRESAEYAVFEQNYREYDYVKDALAPYQDAASSSPSETRQMIDRYRANRRERDVFRQWLADLGLPPDPSPRK